MDRERKGTNSTLDSDLIRLLDNFDEHTRTMVIMEEARMQDRASTTEIIANITRSISEAVIGVVDLYQQSKYREQKYNMYMNLSEELARRKAKARQRNLERNPARPRKEQPQTEEPSCNEQMG